MGRAGKAPLSTSPSRERLHRARANLLQGEPTPLDSQAPYFSFFYPRQFLCVRPPFINLFSQTISPPREPTVCRVYQTDRQPAHRGSCGSTYIYIYMMALNGLVSLVPSVLLAQGGPERSGFVGSVGPARTRWLSKVWIRWFRRSCSHKMALHGLVSLVLSVLLAQKCLLQALRLMYYRLISINMYWCIIYLYIICIHIFITTACRQWGA